MADLTVTGAASYTTPGQTQNLKPAAEAARDTRNEQANDNAAQAATPPPSDSGRGRVVDKSA